MSIKKYTNNAWVSIPYKKYGTEADTITTLPKTIIADGTNATATIKGNLSQSGTPTPTSPIYPSEMGDKTANLFDKAHFTFGTDATIVYNPIAVENGTYTLSTTFPDNEVKDVFILAGNVSSGASSATNGVDANRSMSVTAVDGYITIATRYNSTRENPADYNYMLNTGSTALPYEPYGYKIPILSGGTTTPVYLGEVQSTRQIKKYEFTGQENFEEYSNPSVPRIGVYIQLSDMRSNMRSAGYCSHFTPISSPSQSVVNGVTFGASNNYLYITFSADTAALLNVSDLTTIKAWLAQQYANGTPVTVWYVLATPTTGIVNEPIRKIGDYADSVSVTGIPTTGTAESFDIDTTLKPSEVDLTYHGWHEHSDKKFPSPEWKANSWRDFQEIVRSGKAPELYPVGTILYDDWGNDQSTAFEVVGYDKHFDSDLTAQGYTHSATLQELKLTLRQFDAIEAWLYAETAIPSGTYRFKIPNYDTSYGGNKWYYFTSTTDVPVGGQLTLTWAYNTNPTKVQAYSSNTSTTTLFNVYIAEWIEGTSPEAVNLGVIKLAMSDAESDYGKLNHIHRARYGSNNYWQSGLRQLLNSSSAANTWWQPTTVFDRPYGNRDAAGYLTTLNSNFKDVLATADITDVANNLFESTGLDGKSFTLNTTYDIKDKIFILSHTEVNLSSSPNVGSVLNYYVNAGNDKRLKYRKDNGNVYYWWLRTPYPSLASYVRSVNTSGALYYNNAVSSIGVAAACIIQ